MINCIQAFTLAVWSVAAAIVWESCGVLWHFVKSVSVFCGSHTAAKDLSHSCGKRFL